MDKFKEKYFRITAFIIKIVGLWPYEKSISDIFVLLFIFVYIFINFWLVEVNIDDYYILLKFFTYSE